MGWTQADVDALAKRRGTPTPQKASKYRNVKIEIDGHRFDSKREAQHWQLLKLREKAGEITQLEHHAPRFDLKAPSTTPGLFVIMAYYEPDFTYFEIVNGKLELRVIDAKGQRTRMYLLKKKWLELQEGIIIQEV